MDIYKDYWLCLNSFFYCIAFGVIFLFTNLKSSAQMGMDYLRTPDARFENLQDYQFMPHYIMVDDYEGGKLRMHYIDEGPKDAPTLLMIHGNPTWIYQFRKVIPILNAVGYRTIAVDLMGMGRSDKPTDFEDYTYDRHVGWMAQFFTQIDTLLGLGQVSIFGHDYGTPIGIRLMSEHFTDRFDAFIDANASLPDGSFISPVHLNWRQFVRENPDVPVGHVISSQLNEALSPEEIYGYYAPWPNSNYKAAIRSFPEMVPESQDAPEAIANLAAWSFMETYTKPFMSIFGEADLNLFNARRDFIERVPGAYGQPHPQLKVTHYAPEDNPQAVAQEIIAFLNDVYHPDPFIPLKFEDFNMGLNGFVECVASCSHNQIQEALQILPNSEGIQQSQSMDLSSAKALKIAFRYETSNFKEGEAFTLDLWDGKQWESIGEWVANRDFANGVWDYGFVRIERLRNQFSEQAKIRIRNLANIEDAQLDIMDIGFYARKNVVTHLDKTILNQIRISLSPNPCRQWVRINFEPISKVDFFLLDTTGRLIQNGTFTGPDHQLNLSAIPSGIYFLRLCTETWERSIIQKIIKQ